MSGCQGQQRVVEIRPRPDDFEQTFIRIGRAACEEHYHARRTTVTRWIEECGREWLICARLARFRSDQAKCFNRQRPPDFEPAFVMLGHKGAMRRYRTSFRTVNRWIDECGRERLLKMREKQTRWPEHKLNTRDIGRIISSAFPVRT